MTETIETTIIKLDPKAQPESLVHELNVLTANAFGKDVPMEETQERFDSADVLLLLEREGKIVGYGFNDILTLAGQKVNYFGSGFIAPEAQGFGLYGILKKARVEAVDADVIMTRTQNPRVVSGFARLCDTLGFEMSPSEIIKPEALAIARAYAPECTDGMVCHGVYGRELMGETPNPLGLAAGILRDVNPEKGDGIILVGKK